MSQITYVCPRIASMSPLRRKIKKNKLGFNLGRHKAKVANRLMKLEAGAKKRAREKSRQAYLDAIGGHLEDKYGPIRDGNPK